MSDLLTLLKANGGWMTRADLARYGYTDRDVRAARQASKGTIIFGQSGFKATECATLDEIQACEATLRSMSDAMLAEVQELWRVKNRRIAQVDDCGQGRLAV